MQRKAFCHSFIIECRKLLYRNSAGKLSMLMTAHTVGNHQNLHRFIRRYIQCSDFITVLIVFTQTDIASPCCMHIFRLLCFHGSVYTASKTYDTMNSGKKQILPVHDFSYIFDVDRNRAIFIGYKFNIIGVVKEI